MAGGFVDEFVKSILSFIIIMDPFVSVSYFLSISKSFSEREKKSAVNNAALIAATAFIIFLVTGQFLLSILGVSIPSFKIAGGLVLLVISLKFMLGALGEKDLLKIDKDSSIMIIGIPLITGPGVLTTIIILTSLYGYTVTLTAGLAALSVVWGSLRFSRIIGKVLGRNGLEIASRIMGLLLTALAVEFIIDGIRQVGLF